MVENKDSLLTDESFRRIHDRRRDNWFHSEVRRQSLLSDDPKVLEPSGECPKRVGFHFVSHEHSQNLRLLSVLVCEENQLAFLKNNDAGCYGCSICGMEVGIEVVDVLAKASLKSLKTFRKNLRPRRKFRWPWEGWFQNKKVKSLSET